MLLGPRALRRVATAGLMLALLPFAAAAHEQRDVGEGRYSIEIGFRDEPAYVGQANALYLRVGEYATGGTEPVEGLAATLSAEVSKDGQTKSLDLVPMEDGVYESVFVPTAIGDYTFRFSGTIGETPVDESVTSGPRSFNSVQPLSAIQFPVSWPDPAQIEATAAEAQASAALARTLGIAGIVAGLLGLIVGAAALARSGRARAESAPAMSEPAGKLVR